MGAALKLSGAVDSSPLGKYHPIEGVWDSTVLLWDAGYSAGSGVPANGATITNLVRDRAAAVTGLSASECDLTVLNQSSTGFIAVERTSKGGIHIASTQAGAQNAAAAFNLFAGTNFKSFMLANTDAGADYALMMTLWLRVTRAGISNPAVMPYNLFSSTSTASGNTHGFTPFVTSPIAGANVLATGGQAVPALNVPGVSALVSQGWMGTKPTVATNSNLVIANVGAFSSWGSNNYNKAPSAIIYRAQLDLVDLSDIAGATRAAKAEAMIAQHNALAAREFAAGGRFYNDTFTAAATLKA